MLLYVQNSIYLERKIILMKKYPLKMKNILLYKMDCRRKVKIQSKKMAVNIWINVYIFLATMIAILILQIINKLFFKKWMIILIYLLLPPLFNKITKVIQYNKNKQLNFTVNFLGNKIYKTFKYPKFLKIIHINKKFN